jgi:enoyl-CoA hydratase/carnithine racemase
MVEELPFPTLAPVHGLCLTAGLRVLPDGELAEKSMAFARRLADGPTLAHLATKRIVRAYLEHGVRGADDRTASIGAPLFETDDLQGAVRSFLTDGPGKASFAGR